MTTITEAQRVALVKAADALWDRWNDESYYVVNDLLDNATIEAEDASPLWREVRGEESNSPSEFSLRAEGIRTSYVEVGHARFVEIATGSQAVVVYPDEILAFIAMLTEVQRRIGGEAK